MKKILIAVSALAVVLGGTYFFVKSHYTEKVKARLDAVIAENSEEYEASYGDVNVDLFTQSVEINNFELKFVNPNISAQIPSQINPIKAGVDQFGAFLIDSIVIRDYDDENDFPLYADFELNKVEIANYKDEKVRESLDSLGLESFVFDFDLAYEADIPQKTLDVSKLILGLEGMGSLEGKIQLENFEINQKESADTYSPAEKYLVKFIQLELKNEGIVEHALESFSKERGVAVDKVKENFRILIQFIGNNAPDEKSKINSDEMLKFIDKPERLKFEFNPENSVGIPDLFSLRSLGDLSVKAN